MRIGNEDCFAIQGSSMVLSAVNIRDLLSVLFSRLLAVKMSYM
jgi:hypothetical protein